MKIKKFTGENMKEAMAKVKAEFGDDAVILHSKSTSRKGFRGLFTSPVVEITAGMGAVPSKARDSGTHSATSFFAGVQTAKNDGAISESIEHLAIRIEELEGLLEETIKQNLGETPRARAPKGWTPTERALLARGFSKETVEALVAEAGKDFSADDSGAKVSRLKSVIEGQFNVGGPVELRENGRTVAVFIGATGVGKTTTLAKIGAQFRRRGKKPGFLTADTYRIAAVDQLRRYAEILQVPLEVVYSADDVPAAMQRLEGVDLVLVDTAGRSQYNDEQMRDLERIIKQLPGAELLLLIQTTSLKAGQAEQIERFGRLGACKLIYTKVDELPYGAPIVELARLAPIPVSYVTDGQEVPNDIWPASSARLARLALTLRADRGNVEVST